MEEKLRAAAKAGFGGIDLFWDDYLQSGLKPAQLRNMLDDLNLRLEALQPIRGFEGDPDDMQRHSLAQACHVFELASALGARLVGVCSNEKATACGPAQAAATLHQMAEQAGRFGLSLAYEGLSWSPAINTIVDVWRTVKLADADNLGLVIDSFHSNIKKDSITELQAIDINKILLVQLSDARFAGGDNVKETSRHHRCLPGDGAFDIQYILKATVGRGYCRAVTLEVFNDLYRAMDPFVVAKHGWEALRHCMEAVDNIEMSRVDRAGWCVDGHFSK